MRVLVLLLLASCPDPFDLPDPIDTPCPEGTVSDGLGGCPKCPFTGPGVVCNDAGTCAFDDRSGVPACTCELGWSGTACDAFDDCALEPCANGGQCTNRDPIGDYTCDCGPGYLGDRCELPCDAPRQAILGCSSSHAALDCTRVTDGDVATDGGVDCQSPLPPSATSCTDVDCEDGDGCLRDLWVRMDLDTRVAVSRVRFLSDWWAKRPDHVDVWVSDDPGHAPEVGARLAGSGRGEEEPWQCVGGEACTEEVPDVCCPDGRDAPQDLRLVGELYPKWDTVDVTPTVGAHVWLRIRDTRDRSDLILREIEVYGSDCLDGQ